MELIMSDYHPVYIEEALLMQITEVICRKMDEKKISVKEMAAKLGWSHSCFRKILRGDKELNLSQIAHIYSILEINEDEYFGGK